MKRSTAEMSVSQSPKGVFRMGRWYQSRSDCGVPCSVRFRLFAVTVPAARPRATSDRSIGAVGCDRPDRRPAGCAPDFLLAARLVLGDERIISQGLLTLTGIRLDDVIELKWLADGPGGVDLKTNFERVRIVFSCYPLESCLPITEFLREAVPPSMQHNWNLFCLKVALPLRTGRWRIEVLLPRGTFDRLCFALMFVELSYAVGHWWVVVGIGGNWWSDAIPGAGYVCSLDRGSCFRSSPVRD